MSTTNNILLYFEARGGTAVHGTSGQSNQLQLFTASGMGYSHWTGAISLHSILANGTMSKATTGSGALRLPMILASGEGGASGAVVLPLLVVTGEASNTISAEGAILLPSVVASGTALAGGMADGAMVMPSIRVTSRTGARGTAVLPSVLATGAGRTETHAFGALILPSVVASGAGSLFSQVAGGAIVLPSVRVCGQARGALILPSLIIVTGHASTGVAGMTTRTWAYNVNKNAVTEFPAFFFQRFFRWRNQHYGLGSDGALYLLEGETDAGVVIPWAFETGLDNMDSTAMKGVKGVYLDGLIEAGAELTLVTDEADRYVYRTHAPSVADRRNYRVVTGKGIRTCNIGVALSSTVGGYFEIDRIAPKYDISKRNI